MSIHVAANGIISFFLMAKKLPYFVTWSQNARAISFTFYSLEANHWVLFSLHSVGGDYPEQEAVILGTHATSCWPPLWDPLSWPWHPPPFNAWSPRMLHFAPFHTLSFTRFTSCAALPIKCSVSSYSLWSCPFIYVGIWIFLKNISVCLSHKTVVKMWSSHWSFPYRPQKSVFLLLHLVGFGLQ